MWILFQNFFLFYPLNFVLYKAYGVKLPSKKHTNKKALIMTNLIQYLDRGLDVSTPLCTCDEQYSTTSLSELNDNGDKRGTIEPQAGN